jgi:hypothetical protein
MHSMGAPVPRLQALARTSSSRADGGQNQPADGSEGMHTTAHRLQDLQDPPLASYAPPDWAGTPAEG